MCHVKPLSEASMRTAEDRIPALATHAGREAHVRALALTGRVVMRSVDGFLIERWADGHDVVIKRLPDSTPVQVGAVLVRVQRAKMSARRRWGACG